METYVEELVKGLERRVRWLEERLAALEQYGVAPPPAPAPAAPEEPPPPQTGLAIMVGDEQRGFLPYAAPPDEEEMAELLDWVRGQEQFSPDAVLAWQGAEEETLGKAVLVHRSGVD